MNKPKFTIGISGICAAGKNSFCEILKSKFESLDISCSEVSFATALKIELRQIILDKYNIDILNCDREQKDLVRDELIEFAKIKREETNGTFFWNKLKLDVDKLDCDIILISDARHAYFEQDEHHYIQNLCNGIIVHLRRYDIVDDKIAFREPPNKTEAFHDPIIRSVADFKYDWQSGEMEITESLFSEILEKYNKFKFNL